MKNLLVISALVIGLSGCSGIRQTDETFGSHAENVNVLFMQFPGGDTQERAMALAPENSEIVTIKSTVSDTSSVVGVLNRIIGVDQTKVAGIIK
ncbi:tRNA modification GTPase [Moritella sp. Urea-trap-13]|uniref:tRNA modification GTPase n=1 Tax=Moritella sp. Urea-trap-13 TaxID=2058327 RepID=UPI000C31B926|nr:tRNA modification GTPase [Moritella sp. Urea-trap-13]PKH07778.1 tRNA modification GTPase [Moritella sp. Urea-trap-13]